MRTSATSRSEFPVFFPAAKNALFGIITEPASGAKGVAVIILPGGSNPSVNINGLSVRFCRRIAASGFHAFRFDYHGVGESSGHTDRVHLATPFVADLDGAVACLRARGLERFILVGSCFGARTALASAPSIRGLQAIALISPPVRDFEMGETQAQRMAAELSVRDFVRRAVSTRGVAGLLLAERRRTYYRLAREKLRERRQTYYRRTLEHWLPEDRERSQKRGDDHQNRYATSPRFLDPLRDLIERGTSILFVYGDADEYGDEFARALKGVLGEIVLDAPSVSTTTLSGRVHGFVEAEIADVVFDRVTRWILELPLEILTPAR